jgi:two-component system, NarL family, response regulator NreC
MLADVRDEALLDAVLDVVGARLVLGDVDAAGEVRLDMTGAGVLIDPGDAPSVVALVTRMVAEGRLEADLRLPAGDGGHRQLRVRCRTTPSVDQPGHRRAVVVCEAVTGAVNERTVGVLIVDDHRIVADGLRLLLDSQPDIQVIGAARSLEAAQAMELDPGPEVILVDLVRDPAQGTDVVTALQARFPAAAVLVLTMVDDWVLAKSVLMAGARGYLPKAAAPADLIDAVRRVAGGEDYLHHSVGVALARGDGRATQEVPVYLSDREMAVGRLLALGHTNAEVADLLIVSVRTVETYRAQVFRKLGVHSRAELVRTAVRTGLIDLSSPL